MKKITITIEDADDRKEDNVLHPFQPNTQLYPARQNGADNGWVGGKDICASCPNDPRNGGSGICMCTIPHMFGPNRITCCYY